MWNNILKYHNYKVIIALFCAFVFFFTRCMNKENEKKSFVSKIHYEDFAGSSSCQGCHKSIYDSHVHTAHFLTSAYATAENIKGSFESGKNFFPYSGNNVVVMEKRDSGFYQVEYTGNKELHSFPFNIVFGSGTKGQSYMYWKDSRLYQLPITYFSLTNQWCNSPGFPFSAVFNRPITSRCVECHATFAAITTPAQGKISDQFDTKKIILGVDCEKCHGPAAMHVSYQTQNPKETKAKYIINPATFSRQQNLDLCALCHGGRLQKTTPSFEFTSGNKLADYFKWDTTVQSAANIDVHGNQYGLLKFSNCFLKSTTLTCNTCHNTHQNEKGMTAVFSQRCMTCHNDAHGNFCTIKPGLVADIKSNCIDCHMPKQASRSIAVFLRGQDFLTPTLIHTHYITKYPDETKEYIEHMKKQSQKK